MSNHAHHRPKKKTARPPTALLAQLAAITCQRLGCDCDPDLGGLSHGEIPSLKIKHDPGCPAEHAGSVRVAYIAPGRT